MINESEAFAKLYAIVTKLRAPEGCAWDRQQTTATLRTFLIEEAYEAVAAIDDADDANLMEELGDVYLLVTMMARIKEEEQAFSVGTVLEEICTKLIRRHPHVFGDSDAKAIPEILEQWHTIKREIEGKGDGKSLMPGIADGVPPLAKALNIQKKAGRTGFDWSEAEPVWEKLTEEIEELKAAVNEKKAESIEIEMGDLLFSLVNLARRLGVDPSLALNSANRKFMRRFRDMEDRVERDGGSLESMSLEQMDAVWDRVKAEEEGAQKA